MHAMRNLLCSTIAEGLVPVSSLWPEGAESHSQKWELTLEPHLTQQELLMHSSSGELHVWCSCTVFCVKRAAEGEQMCAMPSPSGAWA